MYALFTLTIFLGSALLFLVQPMVAKMILPVFGGAPNVWNASLVFFQASLLAGYGYAHLATKWLGVRRQALLHGALAFLPLATLPFAVPSGFDFGKTGLPESVAVVTLLTAVVGLPFFMVSAGAPLIQRWFGATGHLRAADPYFLYAASNLGSLTGLLAYPFLIEPRLGLKEQSRVWTFAYLGLAILLATCAVATFLAGRRTVASVDATSDPKPASDPDPKKGKSKPGDDASQAGWKQKALWMALAGAPSCLLLGVTNFLTANVAAVPLLWVVPLSLYLITYVAAFSRRSLLSVELSGRIVALALPILAVTTVQELNEPLWLVGALHLLFFTLAAYFCHRRLAALRPPLTDLTGFYFWLSLGGVIGGAFGALAAPVLFNTVIEYPLTMCLIVALRPPEPGALHRAWLRVAYPAFVAAVTAACILIANAADIPYESQWRIILTLAFPVVVALFAVFDPWRQALSYAAFFIVATVMHPALQGTIEFIDRSFFGVHRVLLVKDGRFRNLLHGNTIHGRQFTDPELRDQALTYYHETGPIGQVFDAYKGTDKLDHVGIVGLGVGSLATYGHPGQQMDYFEIDPVVVRIARDTGLFTFLADSKATIHIIMGDGRLSLAKRPDSEYGLLVLDAFSSDAIPIHLLTREAIAMYVRKLRPGGVLAFHISNRYLDLTGPLYHAAKDLGLAQRVQLDPVDEVVESRTGKTTSIWMLLARTNEDLGSLGRDIRWPPLRDMPGRAWTDDYSNLLSVWKEKELTEEEP